VHSRIDNIAAADRDDVRDTPASERRSLVPKLG
jgi:hypothetical protein